MVVKFAMEVLIHVALAMRIVAAMEKVTDAAMINAL
jgi:hypothetical protein